jgi:hypothetical protein
MRPGRWVAWIMIVGGWARMLRRRGVKIREASDWILRLVASSEMPGMVVVMTVRWC